MDENSTKKDRFSNCRRATASRRATSFLSGRATSPFTYEGGRYGVSFLFCSLNIPLSHSSLFWSLSTLILLAIFLSLPFSPPLYPYISFISPPLPSAFVQPSSDVCLSARSAGHLFVYTAFNCLLARATLPPDSGFPCPPPRVRLQPQPRVIGRDEDCKVKRGSTHHEPRRHGPASHRPS